MAVALVVACGSTSPAASTSSGTPSAPGSASPAASSSLSASACASPAVTPPAAEPQLVRAATAYDKQSRQVILLGVTNGANVSQTWGWTAASGWKQLSPAHSPPGRTWGNMAYDDATGTIVLFGGQSATPVNGALNPLDDTWTWNGSDWTQQTPPTSPPATVNMALVFDPSANAVLGVRDDDNAQQSQTWKWDGSAWTQLSGAPQYPKMGAGIAYAPAVGVTLVFGTVFFTIQIGPGTDPKTWTYASGGWTSSAGTAATPPARDFPGMASDPSGGVLMFGGGGGNFSVFADTWTWNGTWTKQAAAGPSQRSMALIAYDSTCKLDVLYGGEFQSGQNSMTRDYDTWIWNGQAWTKVG